CNGPSCFSFRLNTILKRRWDRGGVGRVTMSHHLRKGEQKAKRGLGMMRPSPLGTNVLGDSILYLGHGQSASSRLNIQTSAGEGCSDSERWVLKHIVCFPRNVGYSLRYSITNPRPSPTFTTAFVKVSNFKVIFPLTENENRFAVLETADALRAKDSLRCE